MEDDFRSAAFQWLREQYALYGGVIPRDVLAKGFELKGAWITLVGPSGIWKPKVFASVPLSITSIPEGPYDDTFTSDGYLQYRYRGTNPAHRDNEALREAMRTKTPLIYFHGIMTGRYIPVWPVFIVEDYPEDLSCLVAVDPGYALNGDVANNVGELVHDHGAAGVGIRRYIAAVTRQRLHQQEFRERVMHAYAETCALCKLRHRELLDASHIIPDTEPLGDPIVPNGLCLCKIHHAAYDKNMIGISPEYIIHVRDDILDEKDGPMLQHAMKGLHDTRIILPRHYSDKPDRDRLAWRFSRFKASIWHG